MSDLPGVLNQVTGVFARRGYNVQSLAVGNSEEQGMSRITMVIPATGKGISSLIKQVPHPGVTRALLLRSLLLRYPRCKCISGVQTHTSEEGYRPVWSSLRRPGADACEGILPCRVADPICARWVAGMQPTRETCLVGAT